MRYNGSMRMGMVLGGVTLALACAPGCSGSDDALFTPAGNDAGVAGAGGTADAGPGGKGGAGGEAGTGGTGPAGGAGGAGGSAGGSTGGAAGSTMGGSAGSSTGGAAGSATGGSGGSSTGGAAGSAAGGAAGSSIGGAAGSAAGGAAGSAMGGAAGNAGGGAAGVGGSGGCPYTDAVDHDGDGWSWATGDCNDCAAEVNPGAFDGAGGLGSAGVDDDCDGTADNAVTGCDSGLALADPNAYSGARALGLCAVSSASAVGKDKRWGVLSAAYVKADGSPGMNALSHGLTSQFGAANVQQGSSMLVLSSGTARAPNEPGYKDPGGEDMLTQSAAPPGFPKASTKCPGVVPGGVFDPAALELQVRVPTNARSFSFAFNFYSYEFPTYVCSAYADVFIVLQSPMPAGVTDGNITFDGAGDAISSSANTLLRVCQPQTAGGLSFACELGTALLTGTGFEQAGTSGPHAATGWLRTSSPVLSGSVITLRFAIWDAGDHVLDSTVLLDAFEWSASSVGVSTAPLATPK